MRCHYQVGGEECWRKGHCQSWRGGREVLFNSDGHEVSLHDAEVLIHNSGLVITGYVKKAGEDVFTLESIEVRHTKPRKA